MKKLLLTLLFITTFLKAEGVNAYNEYKVDLYYANGIMMQDSETKSKEIWRDRVKKLLIDNPHLRKRIGKTDVSYNISEGMINDLWEAFMQKVNLEPEYGVGWSAFKTTISRMGQVGTVADFVINASEFASSITHDGTLNEQMENYKQSIKLGHGVVVVAHSQGNLFTAEAYQNLEPWMQKYFHTIAVATPASSIPNSGNGVTFYNDMINLVPSAMNNNIDNTNKHDYYDIERNALGDIIRQELLTNQKSAQYHGFDYYLGYAVYEEALREGSTDVTVRAKRKDVIAKGIILTWLYDEIVAHHTRDSQWKVTDKLHEGTEEYRVTLTHEGDSENIKLDFDVYPFNLTEGKLYQLKNSGNYVMASFGGEKILDKDSAEWVDKEDSKFYKLQGTDPVEYIKTKLVYLQVSRSSASISSVKLYMTDGTKSILVYPREADVHGSSEGSSSVKEFSVRDGSEGTPSNSYDRYLSSKWAGTIYEGHFNDMVIATMPFDGFEEGFWCNNTHGGDCKRDDNFPTYYILSNNSDYLNNVYTENFLSVNQ